METDVVKIREAFDTIYLNRDRLAGSQLDFVDSLKKFFNKEKTLSTRQQQALFEICKYHINAAPDRYTNSLK